MRTFRIELETKANHSGDFDVPEELLIAHIIEKTHWTVQQIRATPQHEIDKLIFYWHLQAVAEKARERKSK